MIDTIRHAVRLFLLARAFARHDCLWIFAKMGVPNRRWAWIKLLARPIPQSRDKKPAERLAAMLDELGPCFVKFGQALATRGDIIGDELAYGLAMLQDRMAPFPDALTAISESLDAPLDTLFRSVEREPCAAASIAQVHRAITTDGRQVAIKVMRPGIEHELSRDVAFIQWLGSSRLVPLGARIKLRLRVTASQLARWIVQETDMLLEGAAASEFARNCNERPGFHVSLVDWDRSAGRVLTLEWIDGVRIDDLDTIVGTWGLDPQMLLRRSIEIFFETVFRDGYFHADLHMGNILVERSGRLCPVDFGIMGRISMKHRIFLIEVFAGFIRRDYRMVAQAFHSVGFLLDASAIDDFATAIAGVAGPAVGKPMEEISIARILGSMLRAGRRFDFEPAPELLQVQKSVMMAEGLGRALDPNLNVWVLAQDAIETHLAELSSPAMRIRQSRDRAQALQSQLRRIVNLTEQHLDQLVHHTEEQQRIARRNRNIRYGASALVLAIAVTLVLVRLIG